MYSQVFCDILEKIDNDKDLTRKFVSTSQSSRVFDVISTNMKTLNTFYTYYDDVTNHPGWDNHQKIPCCRKLKVMPSGSEEEQIRGKLLSKFGEQFIHANAFPKAMFATLLLLNSDYRIHNAVEDLYAFLPGNLLEDFDSHLGEFLSGTSSAITNPIMGIFALYSDKDALFAYMDVYTNEPGEFTQVMKDAQGQYLCISKRISNCQRSTFPVEAAIFSLYTMFAQNHYFGKTYPEIAELIVDAYAAKIASIGKDNINDGAIYRVCDDDIQKIRDFLAALNEEEQQVILNCLGTSVDTATKKTRKTKSRNYPRKANRAYLNQGGKDVIRTCKARVGHSKFRTALFNQEQAVCAIPGCGICGDEHVIASHIVSWIESSELEKTDPNNGLVFCPNHDHLFDNHLISFDAAGKIMISSALSSSDRRAFGLNENIKLDISSQRELYMKRHREKFKK